ncbi:MAG: mannose-1-phosphate guanylyltransferase/mannose-6-phosphate isomerase [Gammaproteobacteria bacterium]|nr:mannose-1-phosphate guanylyltransferase/mannose-6-phosphate isomerase [Gammaproteobacteria bacterium]
MLIPVILSGGAGARLWPLSREHYPKQLLSLLGGRTLLQDTVDRLAGAPDLAAPFLVVCNEDHRFLAAEQLRPPVCADEGVRKPPAIKIILEPAGRNTAPAIAIAALSAQERDRDALLLVLPADHLIGCVAAFHQAIPVAAALAQTGLLTMFGIVPNRAETDYGYIKTGQKIPGKNAFQAAQFVEKPDADTAAGYVRSGEYYWNSGMFLFKASHYLEELGRFEPEMLSCCRDAFAKHSIDAQNDFMRVDKNAFAACPAKSVDCAVMEKTAAAAVTPLDAGWNDIRAWSSLWEVCEQNDENNAQQGDVLAIDVQNSYLRAEYRLLAALGVRDLVVVETADAVLVVHKDRVQDVKLIVDHLKRNKREEASLHRKVYRPWGSYETLEEDERFKVKRIAVNPGASLSLQMHYHRSEHWIVVKGTARVVRDEEDFVLTENQSTYIPLGAKHRLENPGKLPLEIIEVQSGAYLGEDDIVRFHDTYGRQ